jgi:DNA-binding GntR family transcriptional regulator
MDIDLADPLHRLLALDSRGSSLVGQIAEWVGRGIIEGRLRPGDDLSSAELARRFKTSRTPVREALMLLEKEGIVEIPPRRRPRVAPLDLHTVGEIYRLRALLQSHCAATVCRHATAEDHEIIRSRLAELVAATESDDLDRTFWANVAFSHCIVELSGDRTAARLLDSLGVRVLQMRHLSMSLPNRMSRSVADHVRLVEAFEDRDEPLVRALTESLIVGALAAIEKAGVDQESTVTS